MRYEGIAKRIARKYRAIVDCGTYFYNKAGDVVAYENNHKNLLVMYVKQNHAIWCHHGIVAVAVAKDFVLTTNYQIQKADVVVINGLCGSRNCINRVSNRFLEVNSSNNFSFEKENSYNLCEPITIIDRDILDSEQFASCNLTGALISVKVADAKGNELMLPYVVGKGLAHKARHISTMGYISSSNKICLDSGIELDVSTLFTDSYGVGFDFDNLIYGVLAYKKTGRKKVNKSISQKNYDVFKYLRQMNSWYWEQGFNTCSSDKMRAKINMTKNGTNYHKAVKVTCNY